MEKFKVIIPLLVFLCPSIAFTDINRTYYGTELGIGNIRTGIKDIRGMVKWHNDSVECLLDRDLAIGAGLTAGISWHKWEISTDTKCYITLNFIGPKMETDSTYIKSGVCEFSFAPNVANNLYENGRIKTMILTGYRFQYIEGTLIEVNKNTNLENTYEEGLFRYHNILTGLKSTYKISRKVSLGFKYHRLLGFNPTNEYIFNLYVLRSDDALTLKQLSFFMRFAESKRFGYMQIGITGNN